MPVCGEVMGPLHRVRVTLCCDCPATVIKMGKAEHVTSLEDKEFAQQESGRCKQGRSLLRYAASRAREGMMLRYRKEI
jgi:hypothetical protein